MKTGAVRKTYDLLVVILFLTVITIPLVGGVLIKDRVWSDTEKRPLVEFPPFPDSWSDASAFSQKFEEYYKDHFGYRERLIYRYQREMEKRFGISGTPLVIKGEGKWLFFTGSGLLDDYRGELRLSKTDVEKWVLEQEGRYKWLKNRGIEYLTFSPPNKQTVYSEYMPKELHKVKGKTRMSQFHEFLSDTSLPFYIALQELMIGSKRQKKLYFSMDTHWNSYGAYLAFREIMEKVQNLFPENKYVLDFPFYKHNSRASGGDLAKMIMADKHKKETVPMVRARKYCSKKTKFDVHLSNIGPFEHEKPLFKKCERANLKAIIFCDSFIVHLQPFLSENFSEVLYLRKEYDKKNIIEVMEKFKPDIVIDEKVERDFFRQLSDD